MADYLSIVYSESERPKTSYPGKLARYLQNKYFPKTHNSFLEFGCGRGELLNEFSRLGFNVRGNDSLEYAKHSNKHLDIDIFHFDGQTGYKSESIDIIFSKSFVEHIQNPKEYFDECYRILRPGGILLTLTPDWRSNYVKFFDDYTHVRPFSCVSLKNIYLASGYENVNIDSFKQLPILWNNPF